MTKGRKERQEEKKKKRCAEKKQKEGGAEPQTGRDFWRGFLKIGLMGLSFERILLILVVLLLSEFAGGLELN